MGQESSRNNTKLEKTLSAYESSFFTTQPFLCAFETKNASRASTSIRSETFPMNSISKVQFAFEWPVWPPSIRMAIIKFVLHKSQKYNDDDDDGIKQRRILCGTFQILFLFNKLFHFKYHKIVNCRCDLKFQMNKMRVIWAHFAQWCCYSLRWSAKGDNKTSRKHENNQTGSARDRKDSINCYKITMCDFA